MRSPTEVERAAVLTECEAILATCTERQTSLFLKVFPGGLSKCSREGLHNALRLLNRTKAAERAKGCP